jgi:CBS domain-containing protein
MQAKDIMSTNVMTVTPETQVLEIAKLMLERHISAVPVVDPNNHVLGIVSEGDLIQRPELGVEQRRSRWLSRLMSGEQSSAQYVKSHGTHAAQVMSHPVVTVSEDTPIAEIAQLLEKRRIKRVPVVRDRKLVGIVTRADLLRGLVSFQEPSTATTSTDDRAIRETLQATLIKEGIPANYVNVVVAGGVVHLWGLVRSEREKEALQLAAESTPGVQAVENHLGKMHPGTLSD